MPRPLGPNRNVLLRPPTRARYALGAIPGLALHSVQHGHNWAACSVDDQDLLAHHGWLREALERCRLNADVLMTNHVGLLLTPQQAERVAEVLIPVGRRCCRTRFPWPSALLATRAVVPSHVVDCLPLIRLVSFDHNALHDGRSKP